MSKLWAAFKRRTPADVTVTLRVALPEPEELDAGSRAVKTPALRYTCVGLRSEETPPSPKSQLQAVGPPAEASAKRTSELTAGFCVEAVNEAAGAPAALVKPSTAAPAAAARRRTARERTDPIMVGRTGGRRVGRGRRRVAGT